MSTELISQKKKISDLNESNILNDTDLFIVSQQSNDVNNNIITKKMNFSIIKNKIIDIINGLLNNYVKKTQDTDADLVIISSGKNIDNNSSKIVLTGKENSEQGLLYLDASNGTEGARLSLRPNGELYLYNDENDTKTHIVRSVNNLSADERGNITLDLPEMPTNVASANKWTTARTITLTGDVTGSVSIDGSSDKQLNVTVKDDSHNHVISNVDGLQATLDGKLTKTGGKMSGNLTFTDGNISFENYGTIKKLTDDKSLELFGGSSYDNGASIVMRGKDHTTEPGYIKIKSENGTEERSLIMKPDGTFTWGGKTVTLLGDCLPLSGGTMTKTKAMSRNVDDSYLAIYGGTGSDNDGAQLDLCGAAHTSMPSAFLLHARNNSTDFILKGSIDGALTWGGKTVERVEASSFASDGSKFYIKYASGLLIQGGKVDTTNKSTSYGKLYVSLAATFKDTNYRLSVLPVYTSSVTGYDDDTTKIFALGCMSSRTTTSFNIMHWAKCTDYFDWLAIGRWK